MIPFSHCRFRPGSTIPPMPGGRSIAHWSVLLLTLLICGLPAPQAVAEDLEIGLYRNGQLVERLGAIQAPDAAQTGVAAPRAKSRMALQGVPAASAPSVSAPQISAEAQRRNAAFASAAQPAIAIRDLLRQIKDQPGQGTPADRQQINTLLQQFVAAQEDVRAVLVETGNRIVQLGLDPIILERQKQTMEHFELESAQLQKLVTDVTSGAPNAVDQALRYLEDQKFQQIPSLEKATPTHRIYVAAAPRVAREEADRVQTQAIGSGTQPAPKPIKVQNVPKPQGFDPPGPLQSSPPTAADLAETIDVQITQAIRDKAAALGNSPLAIHEFVRNNVKFQPYLGSRKGSDFTLQQLAGNDTDQASLLIALLRAAGIPSRYVRGSVEMTPDQAKGWLGVDDTATAGSILTTAGLDGVNITSGGNVVAVQCTRVWVEAYVPYSNYRGVPNENTGKIWVPLDPAFKGAIITPGEDVLAAMGFNTDAFLADYISTFHALSPIEKLQQDIQTWLNANRPGKTVADIERTIAIDPLALGLLPASLPYQALSISSRFSELEDTKRYKVRFHLYDGGTTFIDYTINLPELAPKKLTIHYVGATAADQATIDAHGGIYQTPPNLVRVKPVLNLDDTTVATSPNSIGMGYTHSSDMQFNAPVGASNQQPLIQNDIIAGNSQAIAFDTFLDETGDLFNLGSFGSGLVVEGLLHPTAVDYLSRVDAGMQKAARVMQVVTVQDVSEAIVESSVKVLYAFGVPTSFDWTGLIVDADRRIIGPFADNGDPGKQVPFMKLTGYDGSNMENRVFEDAYGEEAISTIKILELANDAGIGVCTITSSLGSQCPGFSQPAAIANTVNAALAKGHYVTIPKAPISVHLWSGTGYIDMDPSTGAAGYIISGGNSGQISVSGGATVQTWPIEPGCTPLPGTLKAEVTDPPENSPKPGAVFCPDDTPISFTIKLTYDCKDHPGQEMIVSRKTTKPNTGTKKDIVTTYGGGDYVIAVIGAPDDPPKHPRTITLLQTEVLDQGKKRAETLRVAKWENAFDSTPSLKNGFIDLDPDRFYVRVNDQTKKGSGKVKATVETTESGAYNDDATELELSETGATTGVFESKSLLMVSDDVDDDYQVDSVSDDTMNDRSHKVALAGKVRVAYPLAGSPTCSPVEALIKKEKTVAVNLVILRNKLEASGGTPVISVANVEKFWKIARERYAQVGVDLTWSGPTVADPPAGVDLTDGLLVQDPATSKVLASEAKKVIESLGTKGNTDDIHVFYVNDVKVGSGLAGGIAIAHFYYDASEKDYLYNIFLDNDASDPWGGYAAAHELGHLLTDAGHTTATWRLMQGGVLTTTGVTGSRRLTAAEETKIKANSHAH